jgi:hypothetical protein
VPIPVNHVIRIVPNVPANAAGESPYKWAVQCSCGFQALGLTPEQARWYSTTHANVQRFRNNTVDMIEPPIGQTQPPAIVVETKKA